MSKQQTSYAIPPARHVKLPQQLKAKPLAGLLFSGSFSGGLFRLLGDDQRCNFVVGGLGDDLVPQQVRLGVIRTTVNNLLRVDGADPRQGIKLFFGCGV